MTTPAPAVPGGGQQTDVIEYIRNRGSITTFDAVPLGITRLSARIFELTRRGFVFDRVRAWRFAPDGKLRFVMCYGLRSERQLCLDLDAPSAGQGAA
jgi:hypothetical protein